MIFDKFQDEISENELERDLTRHELVCYKLKKAAVLAALDINLKRMHRSPERCARNLMELGLTAFPDKLSKQDQSELLQKLLTACKSKDALKIRELFLLNFF